MRTLEVREVITCSRLRGHEAVALGFKPWPSKTNTPTSINCRTTPQDHGQSPLGEVKLKVGASTKQLKWQKFQRGWNRGHQGTGAEHPCSREKRTNQTENRTDLDSWFGVWSGAREVGVVSGSRTGEPISTTTGAWLLVWEQELCHLLCFKCLPGVRQEEQTLGTSSEGNRILLVVRHR